MTNGAIFGPGPLQVDFGPFQEEQERERESRPILEEDAWDAPFLLLFHFLFLPSLVLFLPSLVLFLPSLVLSPPGPGGFKGGGAFCQPPLQLKILYFQSIWGSNF